MQRLIARESFELDDDHQEFRAICRAFVADRVLPRVADAERTGTFPAELWGELADAGLLGLGHPEEFGGTGGDSLAVTVLAEELARACGGIAVTVLVSAYMAAPHLALFGSVDLKRRYLPAILAGEQVAAIAVTEPGAGSDVAAIRTVARRVDGGYRIFGRKMFVTNAGLADLILVAAKTSPAAGHRGITLFAVETAGTGCTVGRALSKMGWYSSDTRELILDDCLVNEGAVIGEVDKGFYQIMRVFATERLAMAGMGIGLAQAAYHDALGHARQREAFGQALAGHQTIRHTLAEMAVQIESARLVTHRAACRLDTGHPATAESVAAAKLVSARVANMVADAAVQIFGGYGFIEETPVARHYRDARILRIGGGSDEVQLEILGKRLTQ
jgi:acyl-CoA dehydrogenase